MLAHHRHAARPVAQRPKPRHMVRMQMRVHRLHQAEIEFIHELQITVHLLQHRIDDQRLGPLAAGNEIAVGAGDTVKKLAKDHGWPPVGSQVYVSGEASVKAFRFP